MRRTIALLIATAMLALAAAVEGQSPIYPDKPIRIVVPFAVGGIADTFGRGQDYQGS
jgi:tripartite-type tricarboxylate transporter receptor subunit TctC